MEWGNERCLKLIAAYQARPEMWQPMDDNYRNKDKKQESWKEIADEVESTSDVVKAKVNSLLSSFRRERSKEMALRASKDKDGREKKYKSRWFAYKAFNFLMDKKRTAMDDSTTNSNLDSNCPDNRSEVYIKDIKVDDDLEFHVAEDIALAALEGDESLGSRPVGDNEESRYFNMHSQNTYPHLSLVSDYDPKRAKRPKLIQKPDTSTDYDSSATVSNNDDQASCRLFGEYIAMKLRTYSKRTQCVVQYMTNNILFKADMGHYDAYLDIEEPVDKNRQRQSSFNLVNSSTSRTPSSTIAGTPSPCSLGNLPPKEERHLN